MYFYVTAKVIVYNVIYTCVYISHIIIMIAGATVSLQVVPPTEEGGNVSIAVVLSGILSTSSLSDTLTVTLAANESATASKYFFICHFCMSYI